MKKSFNVLDRTQNIHSSYFIEASAGTGKTYSIENIVVRLLIDPAVPCTLEKILIVTFTKAATADLKLRIRRNLCHTLAILQASQVDALPDYLSEVIEKGKEHVEYAKMQIEEALACFEQASIFTIHGFCHRMLKEYVFEGNTSASLSPIEEGISPVLIYQLIKDFFRTELSEDLVSHGQLQRLLTHTKGFEGLEKQLFQLVTKGIEIAPVPTAQEFFLQVSEALCACKQWNQEQILHDFYMHAEVHKEICDAKGTIKKQNLDTVKRFASLLEKEQWGFDDFDVLIRDGVYLAEALNPTKLKAKKQPIPLEQLQCSEILEILTQRLAPVVNAARNPDLILAALVHRCRQHIRKYLVNKEIVGFDDLLTNMYEAVQQPSFALKVRERYSTAIIDEFQDTDPIQWNIFRTIFQSEEDQHSKHLYLVGDPKQSIYGFRQADIYTYLAAGEFLGEERRVSLNTNYRSTQPLIEALNVLFSDATAPGLIALPRLNQVLPYQPVQSGNQEIAKPFTDHRGALHFFAFADSHSQKLNEAEEAYFFPFIADELSQLQAQGIILNTCAVLIADRFQAVRLGNYLQNKSFPIVAQHGEKLTETIAFATIQEVLEAMLFPESESRLKTALASPMFAWSESDILALEDPALLEHWMSQALALRKIWIDKGFSPFFHALLASVWNASGKSVVENLLSQEDGLEFLHSIQQVGELLVEKETADNLPPRQLLKTLKELQRLEEEGEQAIKKRMNPEHQGVRILTIHSSKGLEFDIVFALGVINRSRKPSAFVPAMKNQESPLLTVVQSDVDEKYVEYTRELDAEKIRQLYVAFTRAKRRLYVPLFFDSSGKKIDQGTASPMELYLSLWGHREQDKILEMFSKWGQKYSISISTSQDKESSMGSFFTPLRPSVQLSLPPKANVVGKSLYVHSFTSLATKHEMQEEEEAEDFPPNDNALLVQSVHTLPAGSQIGTLLHQILEATPFEMGYEEVDGENWNAWIRKFVEQTQFASWNNVIAKMVHQALSTPLPLDHCHLALRDLQESHCYREHPFMYAADEALHPEFECRPGYLKGVIDLIFEHQGKFYFLDWKSNWLGPSNDWYTEEHLDEAMKQHDYYLQAEIYQEALKRYLKCVDSRPFEEIFGCGLYVFLRGLEASQGIMQLNVSLAHR